MLKDPELHAPSPGPLTASFRLTPDDLKRYARYTTWRMPRLMWRNVLRLIAVPVALLYIYTAMGLPAPVIVGATTAMSLAWIAYLVWGLPLLTVKRAREYPGFLADQTVTLTSAGVEQVLQSGTSTTTWTSVRELVETGDQLLFFVTPRLAFIVPNHAFTSRADAERFAAAAQAWWRTARLEAGEGARRG